MRTIAKSLVLLKEGLGLKLPPTRVDIGEIRRKYHAAEGERKIRGQ